MLKIKSPLGMSPGGIGGIAVLSTIPAILIAILASIYIPNIVTFKQLPDISFKIAGSVLLVSGLGFYLVTIKTFLTYFPLGKLITTGTYSICRNPLYASFIFFILPSISFLTRSWAFFFPSIILYTVCKKLIYKEERLLEKAFGDEYLKYRQKTNAFWPLRKR